jgi:predicted nucleotidyltransferase
MLNGWIKELLDEARRGLESLYGERLQGVYLFGSRARGEAAPDSDVDLLVVLDRVDDYGGEVRHTGEIVSALALRYDVSVSRVLVSKADWQRGTGPFLLNVRRDALAA